jgi:hypothetical protein
MPLDPTILPVDILILSNGPGELATWVRPVVKALRAQLGTDPAWVRISVVLSPCVNASGQEAAIARSYPEINRVQGAADFTPFLLWGHTSENWDWRQRGVVLFLGGDQFFTLVIGKRLGYRTVTYAEWQARWLKWIDYFGLAQTRLRDQIPSQFHPKLHLVGDLMVEATTVDPSQQERIKIALQLAPGDELIGLLPGSKPAKLGLGLPLGLAIAEQLHQNRPQTRFVIPVAPALDLKHLAQFADPDQNRLIPVVAGISAQLVQPSQGLSYLETPSGLKIYLWIATPTYDLLSQCQLCLTTIGANTAELTALAVPMIILLPTQQQDVMRAWDGLPGLLANLPLLGKGFTLIILWLVIGKGLNWRTWGQIWTGKSINWALVKQGLGLLAWPNIWAGREIVPELLGPLQPVAVANLIQNLLEHPAKLSQIRGDLQQLRGEGGAAAKLAQIVQTALEVSSASSE